MFITRKLIVSAAVLLATSSATLAKTAGHMEPYGTPAQQQQCVANMEASLHGQSVLGSRDTSEYIQDRGNLDSEGLTEYDVMVGRCMTKFYHHYVRAHG